MDDRKKNKVQLVEELEALRAQIARLEGAAADEGGMKELEEKLLLMDMVVEQSHDGIAVTDGDGYIQFCNKAWAGMHGYVTDEIAGKHLGTFHTEEQFRDDVTPFNIKVMEHGFHKGEVGHKRKDGTTFPTMMTSFVLKSEEGKLIGIVGMARDITERKQAEDDLNLAYSELNQIFNTAGEGMRLIDKDFNMLRTNDRFVEIAGISAEQMEGKKCYEVFPGDKCDTDECPLARIIAGEELYEVDAEKMREDGSVVPCIVTATPFKDPDGNLIGIVENFKDVTERKKAEEDRRNLEAQMQHMQKLESLGVLAGGIAHDFNNLLMGILGHADLAIMELTPESPARYNIEQVQTAAVRASELTNQMLAYSGKGRFVVEALNVNKIIEEMVHLIEVSIAKNAVLKLNLTENIPPIEADAAQVRQVILNLITNASDAVGDRSGVITITTGVIDADRAYLTSTFLDEGLAEGNYTFIEVSDTGVGMDAETIEKIFDPFFTTKFTGRGLGLAAVLGIVRGHDGTIKVYSEPGKGTTFKVLFPSSELQYKLGDRETGIRELRDWRGSGTILIVDDEEAVREVASLMLKRFGFDILTANDGREALEVYKENIDDIVMVMLDMTMPHMGGEETFTELRRITPDVKVLLCSGYNEQDATSHFTGKGLAGFIQKPFQLEKLVLKMYRILKDDGESSR